MSVKRLLPWSLLLPSVAWAGDAPQPGDVAWILTATALVLFMTLPGLALFYGGMVRSKNVLSTLMQSFAIACLASVLWVVVGYSLAFSEGNALVGGFSRVMLAGVTADSVVSGLPEPLFVAFQMTFAIITPALITGAFAERMGFKALLWFSGAWLLVVYAPICHQVWGPGGLLAGDGVLDFAGGTVVHIAAGVAGLVAAWRIGPRKDAWTWKVAPHNLVLTVIGGGMLWVGWFGFNAGSALAASGSAAMALLATHVAAAAAGLSWMAVEWRVDGRPTVLGVVTGSVGGLVVITPAAGFVAPAAALAMGLIAGPVCWWGATRLKRRLKIDDSLDAFGVHGLGGLLGALLTGVFASQNGATGLLYGNPGQLGTQLWGVIVTVLWSGLGSYGLLVIIDRLVGLRVDEETEWLGLDQAVHGESVHEPSTPQVVHAG